MLKIYFQLHYNYFNTRHASFKWQCRGINQLTLYLTFFVPLHASNYVVTTCVQKHCCKIQLQQENYKNQLRVYFTQLFTISLRVRHATISEKTIYFYYIMPAENPRIHWKTCRNVPSRIVQANLVRQRWLYGAYCWLCHERG